LQNRARFLSAVGLEYQSPALYLSKANFSCLLLAGFKSTTLVNANDTKQTAIINNDLYLNLILF